MAAEGNVVAQLKGQQKENTMMKLFTLGDAREANMMRALMGAALLATVLVLAWRLTERMRPSEARREHHERVREGVAGNA